MIKDRAISDRMRELAIRSAPGPIICEEDGIMAIVFAIPEGLQEMRKQRDKLQKEVTQLKKELQRE